MITLLGLFLRLLEVPISLGIYSVVEKCGKAVYYAWSIVYLPEIEHVHETHICFL